MTVTQKCGGDLCIENVATNAAIVLLENLQILAARVDDFLDGFVGEQFEQRRQIDGKRVDQGFDALAALRFAAHLHQTKLRVITFFGNEFGIESQRQTTAFPARAQGVESFLMIDEHIYKIANVVNRRGAGCPLGRCALSLQCLFVN